MLTKMTVLKFKYNCVTFQVMSNFSNDQKSSNKSFFYMICVIDKERINSFDMFDKTLYFANQTLYILNKIYMSMALWKCQITSFSRGADSENLSKFSVRCTLFHLPENRVCSPFYLYLVCM